MRNHFRSLLIVATALPLSVVLAIAESSGQEAVNALRDWPRPAVPQHQPAYQQSPRANANRGRVQPAAYVLSVASRQNELLPAPEPRAGNPADDFDLDLDFDFEEPLLGEVGPDCSVNFCPTPCGPPGNAWVRAEYLTWWTTGMYTPPLVITNPNAATPADITLADPDTIILFGGENLFTEIRSGVRIRGGVWLDDCNTLGIEGEWLGLEDDIVHYSATSVNGVPNLARPRLNADAAAPVFPPGNELVGFPGVAQGTVSVDARTAFHTGGVRFRYNLCCRDLCLADCCESPCGFCYFPSGNTRFDFLFGYRFARLNEGLKVTEDLSSLVPGDPFDRIHIEDIFRTESEFHGTDFGFLYEFHRCRWSVELLGKIALGTTRQRVRISGRTVEQTAGLPDFLSNSGVFALEGAGLNIGDRQRDEFTVVPEFGLTLGYRMNDHLKLTFGYSLIYWSTVVRPGDHYDLAVNSNLVPTRADPTPSAAITPRRPTFRFNDSGYLAQGINFGLEFRF